MPLPLAHTLLIAGPNHGSRASAWGYGEKWACACLGRSWRAWLCHACISEGRDESGRLLKPGQGFLYSGLAPGYYGVLTVGSVCSRCRRALWSSFPQETSP